jgi:ubiquinol-cytochrome c reductase cytochrome c1 subunit
MRYSRLTDLGLTEAQIRDNLLFTGEKVGESMVARWIRRGQGRVRRGAAGPVARRPLAQRRLALHLHAQLLPRPGAKTGWNNTVFPNVAMPHVLWEYQGTQVLR